MKLIIILLCLWLDHYMHVGSKGRQQFYFNQYENFIKKTFGSADWWNGPGSLMAVGLPIIILVGLLQCYGMFASNTNTMDLVLGVAVLLFCLGASPLQYKLETYLKGSSDNSAELEANLKTFMVDAGIQKQGGFHREVSMLQMWQSHERFFAIVFWFLILGPIGAIVYRMISWFHDNALHGEAMYADQLQHMTLLHSWAAWPSSRLVALSYTLVGNFSASFDVWLKDAVKPGMATDILIGCGMASLGLTQSSAKEATKAENEAVQGLVHRALLVWVLVIAVATMGKLFL